MEAPKPMSMAALCAANCGQVAYILRHKTRDDREELAARQLDLAAEVITRQVPEWQPLAEMPDDDTMVLAGCPDGRIMVWRSSILARNLRGPTPHHLQFPAAGWMPLPAPPRAAP